MQHELHAAGFIEEALQHETLLGRNRTEDLARGPEVFDDRAGARLIEADRFDKPAAELLDMQDEIVSRLANTLNAELIAAEARRAERSPRPDAMDLYFQGRALQNRGVTRTLLVQARDFFARSLALDPGNIEAAVAAAQVDVSVGSAFMADDVNVHFDAAEAALNSALLHAASLFPKFV